MTKIGPNEKRRILEAIAAGEGDDMGRLVETFVQHEPGARILVSDGDGEVSLLIPVRDEYEGLERVQIAPTGNLANLLVDARTERHPVDIDGIGKFYEVILEPFEFRKRAKDGADPEDDQVRVAIRGEGPAGDWSPLGSPDAWFFDNLDALANLAADGGVHVVPTGGGLTTPPARKGWQTTAPAAPEVVDKPVFVETPAETVLETVATADEPAHGAATGIALILDGLIDAEPGVAWPGEWYVDALDAELPKLEVEPNRLRLFGDDAEIGLSLAERRGVRRWTVEAGGESNLLASADPRAIQRLVTLLAPFAEEAAEHPLLAALRAEVDAEQGGLVKKALEDLASLARKKRALREAAMEGEKARFAQTRRKDG